MKTSALLFATAAAAEGGPAATLPAGDSTVVGRLLDQLDALGVRRAWIVTRSAWKEVVEEAAGKAGLAVIVVASADTTEDLRMTAEIADEAHGRVVIGCAHVLTHGEALAGLLADPRIVTGILGTSSPRGFWSFAVRTVRGRVVSAASPFHSAGRPNNYFLGFVKVDPRDRGRLVAAARHFADLSAEEPERWESQLDRIANEWRVRLWQVAQERETGVAPDPGRFPDPASIRLAPQDEEEIELRLRAAEEDVVGVLVVGLVRSGVHLSLRGLRGFFYATPLSERAARAAVKEMSGYNEDRVALDSAVKARDGFFTTFFVSPYSKYIARFAARRGWTPNAVTTVSLALGIIAAACFSVGSRAGLIAGAVLLQVAFTVDCVDGQLARYTRTFSKLGAWLDSVFDRSKEYLVYGGLAIGASRGFGQDVWTLAAAALILQTFRHLLDVAYATRQHEVIESAPSRPLEEQDDAPLPIDLPAPRMAQVFSTFDVHSGGGGTTVVTKVPPRFGVARAATDGRSAGRTGVEDGLGVSTFASRAVTAAWALDEWRLTRWAKRILVLPIGERFALISLTAAVWTPRVTFIVLLAWGGVAAAYAVVGRMLAALAR
ncbi:MAG: CDP-alcohol phosphatidyltransferase family protein [Actinobacteria bacterium]|nr:CDP-alcohol phosphatidyltransferase family protein [Actinomycetota bacterium]